MPAEPDVPAEPLVPDEPLVPLEPDVPLTPLEPDEPDVPESAVIATNISVLLVNDIDELIKVTGIIQ